MMKSLELCAGAGGQALGLELAGFDHIALVEVDKHCCETLRLNRPTWNVLERDLRTFTKDASAFRGAELVAGGLPCPPFSIAGKQLGAEDERNLFPAAIDVVDAVRPRAVMFENVPPLLSPKFKPYRENFRTQLKKLGYTTEWRTLNASDYGVPQSRQRAIIVALRQEYSDCFSWPQQDGHNPPTVGEVLYDLMRGNGWEGAKQWRERANEIAPAIVGGSKLHGGPDLGPTRAKRDWQQLGVNGHTIADEAPPASFVGIPRLTVRMVARLQGFPDEWQFAGRKTAAYRQVGNAFPPPVARAVAASLRSAIAKRSVVGSVA